MEMSSFYAILPVIFSFASRYPINFAKKLSWSAYVLEGTILVKLTKTQSSLHKIADRSVKNLLIFSMQEGIRRIRIRVKSKSESALKSKFRSFTSSDGAKEFCECSQWRRWGDGSWRGWVVEGLCRGGSIDQWLQICITVMRSRIRIHIKVKSRI